MWWKNNDDSSNRPTPSKIDVRQFKLVQAIERTLLEYAHRRTRSILFNSVGTYHWQKLACMPISSTVRHRAYRTHWFRPFA